MTSKPEMIFKERIQLLSFQRAAAVTKTKLNVAKSSSFVFGGDAASCLANVQTMND